MAGRMPPRPSPPDRQAPTGSAGVLLLVVVGLPAVGSSPGRLPPLICKLQEERVLSDLVIPSNGVLVSNGKLRARANAPQVFDAANRASGVVLRGEGPVVVLAFGCVT